MSMDRQSRRAFLGQFALAGAALSVGAAPGFAERTGWFAPARTRPTDLVHDTYDALLAFVVPGSDPFSIAQGVTVAGPGGVDAGVTDLLVGLIDASTPYLPDFAAIVATILDNVAGAINPAPAGPFASRFAQLSWPEKAVVFQVLDGTPQFQVLSSVLPGFAAFVVYSEAGTLDPATRSLTGRPLGWDLCNYSGVADGRDEFRGYLKGK